MSTCAETEAARRFRRAVIARIRREREEWLAETRPAELPQLGPGGSWETKAEGTAAWRASGGGNVFGGLR